MVAVALVAVALGLPAKGIVVPAASLAGVQLGATPAQVRAAWGRRYGRCRDCAQPTWYYTYRDFQPQGAGVTFRNGRATALFTIWSPPGWHTNRGLTVGQSEAQATALYGYLPRTECGTYAALVIRGSRIDTQIYVYKNEVWGFGLSRAGSPPCH
jgi:hypothetical protein